MESFIMRKTSSGLTTVRLETYLLSKRKVWLTGSITQDLANEIVAKILSLVMDDRSAPIDILINSPGGDYQAGMTIYDVIQTCSTPIRIINIGSACSMAAVLLASGKHGRYSLQHAEVMIHNPYMPNCAGGSMADIQQTADRLAEKQREMHKLLSVHTGKSVKQIQRATSSDNYMNAEETIAFGICDGVISIEEILEGCNE